MRILAITDGRAGHDKQTEGIIAALRRYQHVEVIRQAVDLSLKGQMGAFVQLFFPCLAPLRKLEKEADIILCTGGKTHFPALVRKRKYHLPLCTCMTPGFGFRWLFDLCFVPEHDGLAQTANIVPTLGPPNPCTDKRRHDRQIGLILIGGTNRSSRFWPETRLLEDIEVLVKKSDEAEWIISSSPRTPGSTVQKLSKLAERLPSVRFFDYQQTPKGWVEEQYARANVAWITSDSMSMIYEALTSGCRVGLLPIDWRSRQNKFAENEKLLQQRGLVVSFGQWQKKKAYAEPGVFNEAQRCAAIIMEKWWPKDLL